jgi:predicted transcriptional regulator
MSRLLEVSQAVEAPSAAAAMAYLRAQGWQHVRTDSKWSVFARSLQGESVPCVPLPRTLTPGTPL